MIEEGLETVGGGTVSLVDPPPEVVDLIGDGTNSHTSWIIQTPGRMPPEYLTLYGGLEVARIASGVGLLSGVGGAETLDIHMSGLAHYLSAADDTTHGDAHLGVPPASMTIDQCMDRVSGGPYGGTMKKGTAIRGDGSSSTVSPGNVQFTPLEWVKWFSAAFRASWRVRIGDAGDDFAPRLDVADLVTLWGGEWATSFAISPDLSPSPPSPNSWIGGPGGPAASLLAGRVTREFDASGVTSAVTVLNEGAKTWDSAIEGNADNFSAPTVTQPISPAALQRHRYATTSIGTASSGQLDHIAETVLSRTERSIGSWEVEMDDPMDVLRVPLGAPVALQDMAAGVYDPAIKMFIDGQNGSPVAGMRVVGRQLPHTEEMGCYIIFRNWGATTRLYDVSDYVVPQPGSLEVGRTLGRQTLGEALTGQTTI